MDQVVVTVFDSGAMQIILMQKANHGDQKWIRLWSLALIVGQCESRRCRSLVMEIEGPGCGHWL
jgi:hypothetical protein